MAPTIAQASTALSFTSLITNTAVAIIAFAATSSSHNSHSRTKGHDKDMVAPQQRRIVPAILVAAYVTESTVTVIQAASGQDGHEGQLFCTVFALMLWAFVCQQAKKSSSRTLVLATSASTLLFEIPLLVLASLGSPRDAYSIAALACKAGRTFLLLLLVACNATARTTNCADMDSDEVRPFLPASSHRARDSSYGAVSTSEEDGEGDEHESDDEFFDDSEDEDATEIKRERAKRLKEKGGWWGYLGEFSTFLPILIPRKDRKVQAALIVCVLCIMATRVFNILIPHQLGIVVDQLLAKENPLRALAVWLILEVLSQRVVIELFLSLAKIPIKQFSYRELANAAFNHVLSLPMEFHADRDSAEVMKAIEQGEALTNVLDMLVLELMPTVIDAVIALFYLYSKFNSYVALAMAVAAASFVTLEVYATSWNLDNRRESSKAKREEARVMHQAVQGWQTVAYFNMFGFERRRFGGAVDQQLNAARKWSQTDAYIQALSDLMMPLTFFTLAILVVQDIMAGNSSPGGFVFLLQYWDYLIWPIKMLSHNYRYLMSDLVDAERLLYLLQTKSSIVDKDNAEHLDLSTLQGHVTFNNVDFSYDANNKRQIIHDFSLSVLPGQTIALVGETGAGKSSILKLLLRFYDVTGGSITLDGRDIRDVTLGSLRSALGVVPQDPLLFNASVLENLRYARPGATDAEIHAACRAACIHDKILSFADGYDTKVGEQGVKLSGGEVQRLAIARVFLKDPAVLILDEATSAVDMNTEASIRVALERLMGGGGASAGEETRTRTRRTTFIIAHRLSTVVSADRILVMHEGRIVESGTHAELLERSGGRYAELWSKQIASI
ncbi:ATP-binding cassette subfamily B vacuolar membrane transporter HMT1/ACLQ [Microdochium nivale]|nr:ATP-binding cassette subfamily B vacuolar membrane transporter HMT1/ACLQ [Microdochium nivale]